MNDLKQTHDFCYKHRESVLSSDLCGCFYCCKIFKPDQIKEWVDQDETALCPHCCIDSVLGHNDVSDLSEDFLRKMHAYWFSRGTAYRMKDGEVVETYEYGNFKKE